MVAAQPEFRLAFRIEFDHYVEATIEGSAGVYTCRCLDETDGLGLLVKGLVGILRYPRSQSVSVWEFIGQTWWVFDRTSDVFHLNLLEFRQTQKTIPGGSYVTIYKFSRCAYHLELGLVQFVTELSRAFGELEANGLAADYCSWAQVWPGDELAKLREYLAEAQR